ncbi:hypothetical protein GJAV_G00030370 [Gymnothorax javanicus]|nr:hypothetical protein GJAV_G00030370 [Gymnothorax javanicus]
MEIENRTNGFEYTERNNVKPVNGFYADHSLEGDQNEGIGTGSSVMGTQQAERGKDWWGEEGTESGLLSLAGACKHCSMGWESQDPYLVTRV